MQASLIVYPNIIELIYNSARLIYNNISNKKTLKHHICLSGIIQKQSPIKT